MGHRAIMMQPASSPNYLLYVSDLEFNRALKHILEFLALVFMGLAKGLAWLNNNMHHF